jgi:hypothetical protein
MPKKSRRAKAKQRAAVAKAVQQARSQQPGPLSAEIQAAPRASPRTQVPKAEAPKAQDMASRYQYIVPELKRIGIIAGTIILVLVILSFIIR